MKKLFKKLFKNLFLVAAVISLLSSTAVNAIPLNSINQAFATFGDDYECNVNKETVWNNDGSDDALIVNFYDGDEKVDISAKSGYQLVSVHYDTKSSGTNWISVSLGGNSVTVNPSGSTEVDKVKVVAKKICTSVNINETSISCGEGTKTFSGTSSFSKTSDMHLVVKIDGIEKVHNHTEPSSWSFDHNVSIGNHTITARIYESSNETLSDSEIKASDSWTFTVSPCAPTDVCTNIPDNQLTLPANHYFASAGICMPQTGVCTDSNAANYDNDVTANEYSNNNTCQYPIDLCTNIPDTQTSLPDGYVFESEGICVEEQQEPEDVCPDKDDVQTSTDECEEENEEPVCGENEVLENGICIECDGEGECEIIIGDGEGEENETTPTPTPTKTQTNTGGPGDGLSDGRSDGRSDGMSSSVVQTDSGTIESYTMAPTGSFQNILSNGLFGLGLVFSTLAGASHVKKKKNK